LSYTNYTKKHATLMVQVITIRADKKEVILQDLVPISV